MIKSLVMYFILAVLLLIQTAFSEDFDALLNDALTQAEQESLDKDYVIALRSFNDGLYQMAIHHGLKALKNINSVSQKEDLVYMLSVAYAKTGQRKKLLKLFNRYINSKFSKDTKMRIFVVTNNFFIDKGAYKICSYIKKKAAYLLKTEKPIFNITTPEYQRFDPGVNIFKLQEDNLIGWNELYISKENTTLVEIAKKLDLGYDELRIANPHIDPFDVQKRMAVFIPRRRLLPEQDFEFGTIYINLSEKRLYYPLIIDGDAYVITFPVGIGVDEKKSPVGEFKITQKKEHPEWVVPKSIREENPDLPPVVPPGPNNPLGVRAMRLGHTDYLLHGTSKKFGIGMKVSHGCIRMYNSDIIRLFDIVPKGTKVVITEKDYKIYKNHNVYLEIFSLNEKDKSQILKLLREKGANVSSHLIEFYGKEKRGYAIPLLH
ncbi:L,D-transpeptidase [Persephonella sp.]|uniref:L,D-transpeptidase n=1 Tax=Persephonella sp. TaxID=2060922 RepID=UPI00261B68F4|nr:L,D-transpeptidase [Persephonella sp.]